MIWASSLNWAGGWQSFPSILCCRRPSFRVRITRVQMRYVEMLNLAHIISHLHSHADPHHHFYAFGIVLTFLSTKGQEASC
jgi:hypothetical protein